MSDPDFPRSADIIRKLEADGWQLRSERGGHHVFVRPVRDGHISVLHPKKDWVPAWFKSC